MSRTMIAGRKNNIVRGIVFLGRDLQSKQISLLGI